MIYANSGHIRAANQGELNLGQSSPLPVASRGSFAKPHSPDLLTVGQVQQLWGIHPNTTRSLCKAGLLESVRLGGEGWRRITRASVVAYLGLKEDDNKKEEQCGGITAIYHRKSSGVRGDLESGLSELRDYVRASFGEDNPHVFADLASHVNWDGRKQFMRLLDLVLEGKVKRVVILYKDRLSRLPVHSMLAKICAKFDCTIIYVHEAMDSGKDATQEAIQDLLSFAHTVTTRIYSARAANNKRLRLCEDGRKIVQERINQGVSLLKITRELNQRGHEQENGRGQKSPVGLNLVKKIAKRMNGVAKVVGGAVGGSSTVESFLQDNVKRKESGLVPQSDLFERYVSWCKTLELPAMSKYALNKTLIGMGYKKKKCAKGPRNDLKQYWAWIGVVLKG